MPFYGREQLEALITNLVQVDRGPVVALDGSGGCGRTATLNFLAGQHRRAVPVAMVDAAQHAGPDTEHQAPPALVSPLLLHTAAQLRERCAGFGRTAFHRLMLGHLALVQEPGPDDELAVMRQVVRTYRQPGPRTRLVVELVAGFGLAALANWTDDQVLRLGAEQAKRLLLYVSGGRLRGNALRGAEQWYVDRYPGLPDSVEGALDRMRRSCQDGIEAGGTGAVLVDAFLADLGAARYRVLGLPSTRASVRVSRAGWRGRRALLLLDDADRPPAQRLLKLVCDARAARPDAPDPLLVVAASGGGQLPVPASCAAYHRSGSEADAAALTGAERRALRWLRITLPPLSRAAVLRMVLEHPDLAVAGAARVARVVARLTGGHPLATTRVLSVLASQPTLLDDVDELLRQPASGQSAVRYGSLADEILGELTERTGATPRPGPSFRETLVTLAAARDLDEARRLAKALPAVRVADIDLALSETLWTCHDRDDRPRMLRPIRYFALCELAARRAEHHHSWRAVFQKLRGLCANTTDALPHQLALGEVGLVAAGLAAQLRTTPADDWLARLDEITATPDPRAPVTGAVDELLAGVSTDPLHRCVGRLVVALRMLHDPRLTDDDVIDNLRMFIAQRYREIGAENVSSGSAYRRRADDYDRPGEADDGA